MGSTTIYKHITLEKPYLIIKFFNNEEVAIYPPLGSELYWITEMHKYGFSKQFNQTEIYPLWEQYYFNILWCGKHIKWLKGILVSMAISKSLSNVIELGHGAGILCFLPKRQ